MIGMYEYEYAV